MKTNPDTLNRFRQRRVVQETVEWKILVAKAIAAMAESDEVVIRDGDDDFYIELPSMMN